MYLNLEMTSGKRFMETLEEKKCWSCGARKKLTEFHKNALAPDGLQKRCKNCRKNYSLENSDRIKAFSKEYRKNNKDKTKAYYTENKEKITQMKKEYNKVNAEKIALQVKKYTYLKRYGITKEDYDKMFAEQKGLCAICTKPESNFDQRAQRIKLLAVDHCHKTGKVRGLLCHKCNTSIGLFKESVDIIESAIKYLKRNEV